MRHFSTSDIFYHTRWNCLSNTYLFIICFLIAFCRGRNHYVSFILLKKKSITGISFEDFLSSLKLFSLSFPDTALLAISHQPKSSFFISFASVSTISSRPLGIPQVEAQTMFRSLIYPLSQVTSRMTLDHQYIYTYIRIYTYTHVFHIHMYSAPSPSKWLLD